MKLTEADLRGLYRDLQKSPSACLTEDVLIRAGAGTLDAGERESVAAHIAACERCAREYQIAYAVRPVADALPARRTPWLTLAAAAMLILAFPALLWMIAARQRDRATIAALETRVRDAERRLARPSSPSPARIVELSRPQLEMPIIDLDPQPLRGSEIDPALITIPSTSELFALILHLDDPVAGAVEIRIADHAGNTVWRDRWNAPARAANVTLTLHRRQFPPGSYRVHVAGAVYSFRIGQVP